MGIMEQAREEKPEAPADREGERDRARRYLDLWERNLARIAVHGPPGARPAER
jgi:hypothetical protein